MQNRQEEKKEDFSTPLRATLPEKVMPDAPKKGPSPLERYGQFSAVQKSLYVEFNAAREAAEQAQQALAVSRANGDDSDELLKLSAQLRQGQR